jgi:hypothetical protein
MHSPITKTILSTLPPDRLSMGSGLDGIHRGFASAFGIALGSMVLERRTMAHLTFLGEAHELFTPSVQEAIAASTDVLAAAGADLSTGASAPLAMVWEQLRQQAQVTAYQETFLVLCGVTLLALLPAILARRGRRRERL